MSNNIVSSGFTSNEAFTFQNGFNSPYQALHLANQSSLVFQPTSHTNPGKRAHSPGNEAQEDRRAVEFEEQTSGNTSPNTGAKFPSTLRNKGLRKRYRKEEVSRRTLTYLLDSLDREQILNVIEDITESNPHLRSDFLAAVPRPTLQSVSFAFSNLEKRVYETFPYSREGQSRDRYAFIRVKPKLIELRESVTQYAEHFFSAESEMPSLVFNFIKIATDLVHRLPNWDHASDNEFKADMYLKMAEYFVLAIDLAAQKMEEGKLFGRALVTEWATDLDRHNQQTDGAFATPVQRFQEKLGWVIGLGPLPQASNFKFYPGF